MNNITATNVAQLHSPLLSAALAYASAGWHVLPCWWAVGDKCACGNVDCKSPAKHPIAKLVPWGQNSASADAEKIKQWWSAYPQANIAVYLEPSGLMAIDIDPRNGGLQTIEDIESRHGMLLSELTQFTGGGGEHRVFVLPKNQQLPGKLGAGVDVKANGYIMLEPSNHISGGSYAWEASSDPRDGVLASPLPDWLRDLAAPKPIGSLDEPVQGRVVAIGEDTKTELVEALQAISSDDREDWLKVGMALQSVGDPNWGFAVWDGWSAQSSKYNLVDQVRVWRSFKAKGLDGVTYRTIFGMAKELGVVVAPTLMPAQAVPLQSVEFHLDEKPPVDNQLLIPPGILRDVVDWINSTASKPQPQFAVQAAIGFASTVLGRRFRTDFRNWPCLYLMNIGESGSGKEYAKTAVERLLDACGLAHLIGPSGYSSDSGMHSSLHAQPNHFTVIDEFHRVLEQSSVKGNARAQGTVRALIEAWGRTDSVLRAVGYSTVGMSARDAKALKDRDIANPSLTLLTMAVPSFWESIGSAASKDGFLNRFLIVDSDIGAQVGQFQRDKPVPQSIVDWATQIRSRYTAIVDPDTNPLAISAVPVPITEKAMAVFQAFEADCQVGAMAEAAKRDGLKDMLQRSNEIAMKLALITALSRSDTEVQESDAIWSVLYVKTYAQRTIYQLKSCMADTQFEAVKKQVLGVLRRNGKPMNISRICDSSRKLDGMPQRLQLEVMNSLIFLGKVQVVERPEGKSGRGKQTVWYAAVKKDEEEWE